MSWPLLIQRAAVKKGEQLILRGSFQAYKGQKGKSQDASLLTIATNKGSICLAQWAPLKQRASASWGGCCTGQGLRIRREEQARHLGFLYLDTF